MNNAIVADLGTGVTTCAYDRQATGTGIVHLGIGAFHRAHQAVYTEQVLNRLGGDWGICGVSLRSAEVQSQMRAQDCLYTVAVNDGDRSSLQVIAAINDVLVAPENPAAVIEAMCLASVHVITLTITEKGYCLSPASGELDREHPEIMHDLNHISDPRTAIGLISRALAYRRANDLPGLTIISCDNWHANGERLGRAVMAFCGVIEPGLEAWVAQHCRFPSTMVDRIVPATTEDTRQDIANALGAEDRACVSTEPFSQWVIENDFAGPVPEWQIAGAELVEDVRPFEEMKLRMLNGSHSTLAYLACLSGIETVADAIATPELRSLIEHLMLQEMAPTLDLPGDYDIPAYALKLLQRFANIELRHQTRQIAMDGSQKIPQRLLPALRQRMSADQQSPAIMLGLAAWIRYTRGVDQHGHAYPVEDPLASRFQAVHTTSGDNPADYLSAILEIPEVFEPELVSNTLFYDQLLDTLVQLENQGVLVCAKGIVGPSDPGT